MRDRSRDGVGGMIKDWFEADLSWISIAAVSGAITGHLGEKYIVVCIIGVVLAWQGQIASRSRRRERRLKAKG